MANKLAVLINFKDRASELALLLQSLRTQTFKEFDIYILDDASQTPITQHHFLSMLIPLITMEGNRIHYQMTEFTHGVSRARQRIVDWALEKPYTLFLRVDDDCVLMPDYIERLMKVIDQGYDLATGVTIPFGPAIKRNPRLLKGVINRIILDQEGNFLFNGDDCGIAYTQSKILPAHHFRSCALVKRAVHEKVKYYPTKLSLNGYREETIFSLKMLMAGFKIGCDTWAVNHHLMTPSGGERGTMNMVPFNHSILLEFVKENKDQLIPLTGNKEDLEPLEYLKENNLLR